MCSRKETVREVPGSGGKRHRLRDSRRPLRCESPGDTPQRVSTYADEALCNWFLVHTHVPVEFLDLHPNAVMVARTGN